MIWLTTDNHLGHANMVKYCGRPVNHSELILSNLKDDLAADDSPGVLINLGDVCIGRDEFWHEQLMGVIPPGFKKILLRGNHDKKSNDWYLRHGWDFVCESFSDRYFGCYVTFSHQAIPHIQNLNIHGHMHNHVPRLLRKEFMTPEEEERNRAYFDGLNENHRLLAIENTKYRPVLLDSFIKKH